MPDSPTDGTIEINLKNPNLAALLAWLVPGLGHFYQGRTGKGVLFAACILSTFFYGLYLGGGRVVYASTTSPFEHRGKFVERWQFACQAPVGLAAIPAYMQTWRVESGQMPLLGDNFLRPPYSADDLRELFGPNFQEARREHLETRPDDDDKSVVVKHPTEAAKWHYEYAFFYELGTIFTVIAGLLNVLAIYDAYAGPVMPSEDDKKKGKGKKGKKDDEQPAEPKSKSN